MGFPQYLYPPLPGRDIDDIEREMREQDASAAAAQRNLIVAIAACLVLAVLASLGGLGAGVTLFGGTTVVLVAAFVVVTFVRRHIRQRFG